MFQGGAENSSPMTKSFQTWLSRLRIGDRIAWGYGLALTVAVVGTGVGLAIGDYYHQLAIAKLEDAVKEDQSLDLLQNSFLKTRLYRQKLLYALEHPDVLKQQYAEFLTYKADFERHWKEFVSTQGYTQAEYGATESDQEIQIVRQFLGTHKQSPVIYLRKMDVILQKIDLSHLKSANLAAMRLELKSLAKDPSVRELDQFSQALEELVEGSHAEYDQAVLELIGSRNIRLQWMGGSLLGSILLAFLVVKYSSRSISEPIQTLAEVMSRVTNESNFDLQAPVTSQNEIGVLSSSFNRLIAEVKKLLQEQQFFQEKLCHDALHDALTGLANRLLFRYRLGHAISLAQGQPNYQFALIFLDLDRFKAINDNFGQLAGDQLLIQVVDRLLTCVSSRERISRLGGDEFAIFSEAINDPAEVTQLAASIHKVFLQPFKLNEQEVRITVSIGIVFSNGSSKDPDEMIRNADTALYRAKGQGRSVSVCFDIAMEKLVLSRLQLEADLRRAVETILLNPGYSAAKTQELYLVYQPIVHLETQKLVGFESLLRWKNPDLGLVMPTQLIAIAEETGMILGIGHWVLQTACAQLAEWQTLFPQQKPLTMSVNLSAKQLLQSNLVPQVQQILDETGIAPKFLKLELTETVLLEESSIVGSNLKALQALGINLVVDDFGTGYSSLSYLHRFNLNSLKVDRQFIDGIDTDIRKLILVRSILFMAHTLGMEVVAEGLETTEQLALLLDLGCRYGQGYLFSRPLSQSQAAVLIEEGGDRRLQK
jgi:diguanylate cyclase (GGDEF)-like protein